jgi:hypothetical protein
MGRGASRGSQYAQGVCSLMAMAFADLGLCKKSPNLHYFIFDKCKAKT